MRIKLLLLLCFFFSSAALANISGAVGKETVNSLAKQVEELQKQIESTNSFIEDSRARVNELTDLTKNPEEFTEKLIAEMDQMINSFQTGSEYALTINNAITGIQGKIEEYGSSTSEFRKKMAKELGVTLSDFNNINQRRDNLVARAINEKDRLKVRRKDLEAAITVSAYKHMRDIFTAMLDGVESSVNKAKEMNDAVLLASGLDRQ